MRTQFWTVNPVAGPIFVEGLKAGDLLVLEIEDIIPSERGWTGFVPDFGNLAGNAAFPELQQPYARITRHSPGPSGTTSDGTGAFNVNREVTYPLRPFLGTIVTAPERGIENTLVSQGLWGGNIDCRDVKKGNKVMLNAYHDGGSSFSGTPTARRATPSTRASPTRPPPTPWRGATSSKGSGCQASCASRRLGA